MASNALLLAELVIEYTENGNAAGEYDGEDPRLLDGDGTFPSDVLRRLAYKVKQELEMQAGNL